MVSCFDFEELLKLFVLDLLFDRFVIISDVMICRLGICW